MAIKPINYYVKICISFSNLSSESVHFSLYRIHAGFHANLYLRILWRYLSARPSLWSLQGETGFHSIFCLPLCHASLCGVEEELAAPRSSSTPAQRPELHSAHTS